MPHSSKKLTDSAIKKAVVDSQYHQKEVYLSDAGCRYLGVKARSGSASFVIRKKVADKMKQYYLAKTDQISISTARELTPTVARLMAEGFGHDMIARQLAKTTDPFELEAALRGKGDGGRSQVILPTVAEAIEDYYQQQYVRSDKSRRTRPDVPLKRYIIPKIGRRPVSEVTTREIRDVITPIWTRAGSRGRNAVAGHSTATKMRQNLDQMFELLLEEGVVDRNPVPRATSFPRYRHQPKHNAALEDQYLPEFWRWLLTECGADITTKTGIAMCLLLGSRPGQIINLKWEFIDFDAAVYTSPPTVIVEGVEVNYTKTRIEHRQPIPQQLLQMLRQCQEITSNREWALSSGGKRMSDNTMRKNTINWRPADNPDHQGFTPAGCRATLDTWLVNNNCVFETKEAILQHALPKIQGAYYRDYNIEPRREWLQRYADMVTGPLI